MSISIDNTKLIQQHMGYASDSTHFIKVESATKEDKLLKDPEKLKMINMVKFYIKENPNIIDADICRLLQKEVDSGNLKLHKTNKSGKVHSTTINKMILDYNLRNSDAYYTYSSNVISINNPPNIIINNYNLPAADNNLSTSLQSSHSNLTYLPSNSANIQSSFTTDLPPTPSVKNTSSINIFRQNPAIINTPSIPRLNNFPQIPPTRNLSQTPSIRNISPINNLQQTPSIRNISPINNLQQSPLINNLQQTPSIMNTSAINGLHSIPSPINNSTLKTYIETPSLRTNLTLNNRNGQSINNLSQIPSTRNTPLMINVQSVPLANNPNNPNLNSSINLDSSSVTNNSHPLLQINTNNVKSITNSGASTPMPSLNINNSCYQSNSRNLRPIPQISLNNLRRSPLIMNNRTSLSSLNNYSTSLISSSPNDINSRSNKDELSLINAPKILVLKTETSSKQIIHKLRDILKEFEYYTNECICCDDICSEKETWYKCAKCKASICKSCRDKADTNITSGNLLCQVCFHA